MAKIDGEYGKLDPQIGALFVPQHHPVNGIGMPQIMHARAFSHAEVWDLCLSEHFPEGVSEGTIRTAKTFWPREKRGIGGTHPQEAIDKTLTLSHAVREILCHGHESRFSEFAFSDPENSVGKVNILDIQRYGFSHPHTCQVKEHECRAMHHAAQRRPSAGRKKGACLEKRPSFFTGQDTGYKGRMTDAQKASGRDERAGLFYTDETTELAQKTQEALSPIPGVTYIGPDDSVGNDRIYRWEMGCEEPIQKKQLLFHSLVATADSTLELEESLNMGGQR